VVPASRSSAISRRRSSTIITSVFDGPDDGEPAKHRSITLLVQALTSAFLSAWRAHPRRSVTVAGGGTNALSAWRTARASAGHHNDKIAGQD
jgi:hypothetical protein